MRIVELVARHVRIPLRRTIRHASHTRDETDSLVVSCRLDDGTEGWGEGLPRAYVTGETIDTAFEHLQHSDLPRQLGGAIADLSDAVELCTRLKLTHPTQKTGRDCFGHAARAAVELSVLDAVTRSLGVPLSAVTAQVGETLAIRETKAEVQYSAVMTPLKPWKEWLMAKVLAWLGFRQLKVKVGVAGYDDVARLHRARRAVGAKIDLRIDANEAWHADELEAKLSPLLPFGVSAVEQPVPHTEVDQLANFRGRFPVAIMLDESLCGFDDARRAIERGTCDLFNLRISKCGGFLNTLRLAALAHSAGLGYQLGCQVGETGILSAAGRHFASSVGGIRYLEGSYDRFLVAERLTTEDITFRRGGRATALTGPGLGVHVELPAIARVTRKTEVIRFG